MQFRLVPLLMGSLLTLAGCDSPLVRDAKRVAADQMKDPESVRFRNVRKDGSGGVCGEISGKNGYGAYAGYQRFVYLGRTVILDEGGDTTESFNVLWRDCPSA